MLLVCVFLHLLLSKFLRILLIQSHFLSICLSTLNFYYCADSAIQAESLEKRLRVAEGHIEAGRLLAFYQVGSFSSVTIKLVCLMLFMKGISKSFNLTSEMKVTVLTMCVSP